MSEPVIRLQSVTKTYESDGRFGIRDVSLEIQAGDFVAVVGPSGAGKSTLLNIIGMLDRAEMGQYFVDGVDVAALSESQRDVLRSRTLGFVFQSAFVMADESALRNAALGLQIQGVPLAERGDRALSALTELGLSQRAHAPAKLLSGGERQRLAIARALATRPAVILADESTGNLDSDNGESVLKYLRELNDHGTTVVIVTHDERIAARAQRIIEVRDGVVSELNARSVSSSNPRVNVPSLKMARRHFLDELGDAVSALSRQLRRTVLLALVFALGTGGLVSAIDISSSASAQISLRLTNAAADEVRVEVPGQAALFIPGDQRLHLWMKALAALPHVQLVAYYAAAGSSSATVRRLDPAEPAPDYDLLLASASSSYFSVIGRPTHPAQAIGTVDDIKIGATAVVGSGAVARLGLPAPSPGSTIWVNGRRLSVVGEVGANALHPELARSIFVSPDVMAGATDVAVSLLIKTDPGFASVVSRAAPVVMDPANPGAFSVETVPDLAELRGQVADDLTTLVGVLSGVLLLLSVITGAASLYLSVRSRNQEIALRRALGTPRSGIAGLFVFEGALIGLIGGAVGAAAGTAVIIVAANWERWSPVIPTELVPIGIVLGLATGIVSAVFPAWAASRQQPALAIRG